jgi:hypothetical protein
MSPGYFVGALFMAAALALLLWPQPIDWLNELINLRAAERGAEQGDFRGIRNYPRAVKFLRVFVPLMFFLFGLTLIVNVAL